MNIRMLEAAVHQAENAHSLEELQAAAAALRTALNAEDDPPFDALGWVRENLTAEAFERFTNCYGDAAPAVATVVARYEASKFSH